MISFLNKLTAKRYMMMMNILSTNYIDKNTIKKHIANLSESEERRYDTVKCVSVWIIIF